MGILNQKIIFVRESISEEDSVVPREQWVVIPDIQDGIFGYVAHIFRFSSKEEFIPDLESLFFRNLDEAYTFFLSNPLNR